MAKGKKTGGRDIQKGQVLNPHGRRTPEDIKTLRSHNKFEIERCLTKYLHMSMSELTAISQDGSLSALEMACVRLMIKGAGKGDYRVMDFIFNRLIGKVKEHIELGGGDDDKLPIIVLPSNGRSDGN